MPRRLALTRALFRAHSRHLNIARLIALVTAGAKQHIMASSHRDTRLALSYANANA